MESKRSDFLRGTLTLAIGSVALSGAAKIPQIAVIVAGGEGAKQADLERLQAQIQSALLDAGHYGLVDRTRLSSVLREQGLSNSAYADPHMAAKLGKLVGASRMLFAKLEVEVEDNKQAFVETVEITASATFELVDVSTAGIKASGAAEGSQTARSSTGDSGGSATKVRHQAIDQCAGDIVDHVDK